MIATDINVLAISHADEFQRFAATYKVAYREAKRISPQTKVCVSFQYEVFKQARSENLKVLQDLRPEVFQIPFFTGFKTTFISCPSSSPPPMQLDAFAISSQPRDLFDEVALIPAEHYRDLVSLFSFLPREFWPDLTFFFFFFLSPSH